MPKSEVRKNLGGGTGFGGVHGGAVVLVYVLAAGGLRRKKIEGKIAGTARRPRIAEAGKGFQRTLAAAEQRDDKTLLAVFAVADSGVNEEGKNEETLGPGLFILNSTFSFALYVPRVAQAVAEKIQRQQGRTSTPPGNTISHQ